jgi:hypothetical protein
LLPVVSFVFIKTNENYGHKIAISLNLCSLTSYDSLLFIVNWSTYLDKNDFFQGDDSVTECVYSNGFIQGFSSYNTGYSNPRRLNPVSVVADEMHKNVVSILLYLSP